jgi:hypothetical protein
LNYEDALVQDRMGTLATALVLPPAGLVLQWMRPIKLVHKIAGSIPIAIWFVAWLISFAGLRVQMDGSGVKPMWTFYAPVSPLCAVGAQPRRAGRATSRSRHACAGGSDPCSGGFAENRGGRYDAGSQIACFRRLDEFPRRTARRRVLRDGNPHPDGPSLA